MPDNVYTPRILQLSSQLQDLQDTPMEAMFTPEQVAARRAKQAREEQLAVLAKLSGNKELDAVGASLLPDALKAADARYTEHGEFDPITGKHTIFPEYTRRVKEQRLEQQLQTAQLRGDAAQNQQQVLAQQQSYMEPFRRATADLQNQRLGLVQAQEDLARQKLADAQRKSEEGKPLTGQIYKDVKKMGDDVQNLNQVKDSFEKNFTAGTARGMSPLGALQDTVASAVPGFAPDDWVKNRAAWADLQRLKEMKQRYELFGATLTPHEKASWETVTPPRGSTKEQLQTWIDTQDRLLRTAISRSAEAAAAGGWNKKQLEEYTNGVYKAPSSDSALTSQEQEELQQLRSRFPSGR